MTMEPRKITLDEPMALEPGALYRSFFSFEPMLPFDRQGDCAVVSISGPLVQRGGYWWDGYDAIVDRVAAALADESSKSVLLRIDSPGGSVAGLFEATAKIRKLKKRSKKPMWAYAEEMSFSAAYALACTADRILLPATGGVGSVGVIAEAIDRSKMLAEAGINVALVYSGKRKADLHPDAPLSDEAVALLQKRVNDLADMFIGEVATARGLKRDDVASMEAGLFYGEDAVKAGLADAVMSMGAAMDEMSATIIAQTKGAEPEAKAVPYGNEPLEDDRPWDGDAAVQELRKWASSDGSGDAEKMDWAKYRKGFAWYDADNAKAFGSYKLPHHRVVSGSLKTSKSGVQAAAGAVQGARGGTSIPEADMAGVKSHLGQHYKKWGGKPPWESAAMPAPGKGKTMENVLKALGLSADATEADALAAVVRMSTERDEIYKALNASSHHVALGLIENHKTASTRSADLEQEVGRLRGDIESRDRAALLAEGRDAGKLTPALEAHWAKKPVGELREYLSVAPVIPAMVTQRKRQPSPKDNTRGGDTRSQALKSPDGKTWDEMKPAERAKLSQEFPEVYEAMREQASESR